MRVEEVRVNATGLQPLRIWNGDGTDYGLDFAGTPPWLHETLGAF